MFNNRRSNNPESSRVYYKGRKFSGRYITLEGGGSVAESFRTRFPREGVAGRGWPGAPIPACHNRGMSCARLAGWIMAARRNYLYHLITRVALSPAERRSERRKRPKAGFEAEARRSTAYASPLCPRHPCEESGILWSLPRYRANDNGDEELKRTKETLGEKRLPCVIVILVSFRYCVFGSELGPDILGKSGI